MELNPEIMAVLEKLGVEQYQIDGLIAHFSGKLSEAESSVASIEANIASLQKQLVEETERAALVRAAIGKFVVASGTLKAG